MACPMDSYRRYVLVIIRQWTGPLETLGANPSRPRRSASALCRRSRSASITEAAHAGVGEGGARAAQGQGPNLRREGRPRV